MSRDGSLKVDVLGTVLLVQLAAHEGVQVLVEGFDGPVELLYVLLKGRRLVRRTPVSSSVVKP